MSWTTSKMKLCSGKCIGTDSKAQQEKRIADINNEINEIQNRLKDLHAKLAEATLMQQQQEQTDNPLAYKYFATTATVLPAGRYYIGDLCYALKNEIYHGVFGDTAYSEGLYKMSDEQFFVSRTKYGDGSYKGTNGFEYGVDAGIIGIASTLLCNPEEDVYGGTLHTFTEPVACTFKNGFFQLNSGDFNLEIDTTGESDDHKTHTYY